LKTFRHTNVVLLGAPGSGKGTQAVRLAERFSIPHVSTGNILREAVRAGSPLGRRVAGILAAGGLVEDDLVTELVRERLAMADAAAGFILDGFPRTAAQAAALDGMRDPATIIAVLIDVPPDAIVTRLSTRRLCEACAITQSVSPGSPDGEACPYCGGRLARRKDDDAETVRRRLATYAEQAESVIAHYRSRPAFAAIEGARHSDAVMAMLCAHIDRHRHA
jgi:adenylate kinase